MTSGYTIEDLFVGQSDEYTRTLTDNDVVLFAGVSGDDNPIHLDEAYARGTVFKTRIAHGMLVAGLISCVLGTRLPGPGAIYMGQSLRFKAPVRIGDTVTARCTVREINAEKRRAVIETVALVGDTVVIEGEASVLVPTAASARDVAAA